MGAAEKIDELRIHLKRAQEILADLDLAENEAAPKILYMSMTEFARERAVSVSTVKRWIKTGLPVARNGRVVRVRVEDAARWLDTNG